MGYSIADRRDIVSVYIEAKKNAVHARLRYQETYPNRRCPTVHVFRKVYNLFQKTGNVEKKKYRKRKTATREDNEINVLASVAADPVISSRQIARNSGISQSSVIRILHRHHFHPFHMSLHQALHGNDFQNRVNFCQWGLRQIPSFFYNVLFTDEATFTKHGVVNLRNAHYWSTDNPHWLREIDRQRKWNVNVWCGILNNEIIGPHFINGTLTGQRYAQFLRNDLPVLLENIPLENRLNMWYQHDGCPAHYARISRDVLNELFPNRWIGKGGNVLWPARSPDLNPLDFFLWGMLKNQVYANVTTTAEDMQQRIIMACANVTSDSLTAVQNSLIIRLRKCVEVNGQYFENLLK